MRTFLLLALSIGLASCSKSDPPSPTATPTSTAKDPAAARTLIKSGAPVIDVRNPDEFAGGHVDNAVNLPVAELGSRLADVDKLVAGDRSRPIVVYCGSGRRSAKAKTELEAKGFTHVVNGGGVDDLR